MRAGPYPALFLEENPIDTVGKWLYIFRKAEKKRRSIMRVIIGMPGGVDSAVAAYLLKEQGYDPIGVTLRTWESGGSRCCEIDKARATANVLGIPYHVINCTPDFVRKVQLPFISSYLLGQTPNPCILCNPLIKWEWMLYAAGVHQADLVATGHYVKLAYLKNGRYAVKQGIDTVLYARAPHAGYALKIHLSAREPDKSRSTADCAPGSAPVR